jgi:hypothetical protein
MVSRSFGVKFFGFYRDILTVSLPICMPSSCVIALARNSKTMLNRSGESGHPCQNK